MKIALLFFISLTSLANFTGKWSAQGFYESDRTSGECIEVFMQFKQTNISFMILDGGYICGEIQASYPPSKFTIVSDELFYGGEKVGMITKDKIEISYLEGVYNLNLQRNNGSVHFRELWKEEDDFLDIRAKLEEL